MKKTVLALSVALAAPAAFATDSQIVQRNAHEVHAEQTVSGETVHNEVVQRNSHKVRLDSRQEAGVINNKVIQRNAHVIQNHVKQDADTINNYIDGKPAEEVVNKVEGNYDRSKQNASFISEVDVKVEGNSEAIAANGEAIDTNAEGVAANQATLDSHAETNVTQDAHIAQNARTVSNYGTAMQQGFQRQQSQLDNHEQRITGLEGDVQTLRNDVDQLKGGVALGIAVGTLQYDLSDASSTQMAIASGYYSDHSALAVGLGTPISDNAFFNGNVSATNDGQAAIGAGVTFKFQ